MLQPLCARTTPFAEEVQVRGNHATQGQEPTRQAIHLDKNHCRVTLKAIKSKTRVNDSNSTHTLRQSQ
jgi:hypothetical protein